MDIYESMISPPLIACEGFTDVIKSVFKKIRELIDAVIGKILRIRGKIAENNLKRSTDQSAYKNSQCIKGFFSSAITLIKAYKKNENDLDDSEYLNTLKNNLEKLNEKIETSQKAIEALKSGRTFNISNSDANNMLISLQSWKKHISYLENNISDSNMPALLKQLISRFLEFIRLETIVCSMLVSQASQNK